jgi:Ser-tRNA(Ala) deacylase AlaX
MEPTKLKYFEDPYLFTSKSKVIEETRYQDKLALILDETIFYPQGGGSPYDQGIIRLDSTEFKVNEVRFENGIVYHIGEYSSGALEPGDIVELELDSDRRMLNCKLQTGGHLVDEAVREVGLTSLIPAKGFHFPEGPSVEYDGEIPADQVERLRSEIESAANKMIETGFEIKTFIVNSREELEKYCYSIPTHIPEGKQIRVVVVWGEKGIPCGANHVKNLRDLGQIKIMRIKSGKGVTKISYLIER